MNHPIITLTSDFGLKDPYVAEMKGVILSICPVANIVDVSHDVEKFNIKFGAYVLASVASYFPKGTIHVVVIDPGVGTRRRALCIETASALFLGPDNGVLTLATQREEMMQVYEIRNHKFMRSRISSTFHGRDVFAPAAAHLANGMLPSDTGPEVKKIMLPNFAKVIRDGKNLIGEVIHVDSFGNIVTNIRDRDLKLVSTGQELGIRFGRTLSQVKLGKTFAEVRAGEPLALIGSHEYLEMSVNQGDASRFFRAKSGDKVTIYG